MCTPSRHLAGFTRQQWLTILVIGSVHFVSAICISLQAPFYPQEAESKGGTATEYGLVFGIFELTAFISCPIFGKYLHKTGAKRTLNVGIVVAAISSVFFGLLDYLSGHFAFIGLSLATRVVESLGASAALTAAFGITAAVFPDSVATTFATLEVFYGVGYIAGPTIGGFLFVAGGYKLPFILMGVLMLLVGVLIYIVLPSLPAQPIYVKDDGSGAKMPGVLSVLMVPAVLVDAVCITAASSAMGFYAATLEPHLRQFSLTPVQMCLMFVLSGAMYAAFAPVVGRLCDLPRSSPRLLTLVGCLMEVIGALFVGPAPFFTTLEPTLALCIVGLTIHGLGLAFLLVACFIDALRSSIAHGFPDGLATYGLVAGLWASSFSLGAFVGPSMAGVLYDLVGFRNATYFVLGTQLVVLLVALAFFWYNWSKTRVQKKYSPLTNRQNDEESFNKKPSVPLLSSVDGAASTSNGGRTTSRDYGTSSATLEAEARARIAESGLYQQSAPRGQPPRLVTLSVRG